MTNLLRDHIFNLWLCYDEHFPRILAAAQTGRQIDKARNPWGITADLYYGDLATSAADGLA